MSKKKDVAITMRIRIGDKELEVSGPVSIVETKINEFIELEKQLSKSGLQPDAGYSAHKQAHDTAQPKELAPNQFFKRLGLKTIVDRVLAAGYYLEEYMNQESFTAQELADIIHKAKITPPPNPNDAVNKNIAKAYMMNAGEKDGKMAFVLTSDGEEAIKGMLNQ